MTNTPKWTDQDMLDFAKQSMRDWGHISLDQFKTSREKKEPLFVTTDGVEIYPGMEYFPVDQSFSILGPWKALGEDSLGLAHLKVFSTREAAEAYVFENKPCLSIKEVRNLLSVFFMPSSGQFLKDLTDIVKSKLNG